MSFHVGQKVVCIDNPRGVLKKNGIYTIAAVRNGRSVFGDGLHFEEHPRYFFSFFFRPLIERKTDIAIFKRMLLPQGEDA